MNVEYVYSLSGQTQPIMKSYVINNSATLKRGDFVRLDTNGNIIRATSTTNILGSVAGVIPDAGDNSESGGAYVAPDSGTEDTWTVASDNETVAKKRALVNVDPFAVYRVDFSADIGTTSGSVVGARFDLTDHDTVNEASAGTGTAQVALIDTIHDDADRGEVMIVENQVAGV